MGAKEWYYEEDGHQMGPYSQDELRAFFEEGRIHANAVIWNLGNPNQKLKGYSLNAAGDLDQPAPVPREAYERHEGKTPQPYANEAAKPRIWVRYWARMLDYLFFGFICGVIIGIFDIPIPEYNQPFLGLGIIFLWVFLEAIFVSTWGTTPGKWMLKSRVRTSNGKKLSFLNALNRSFGVWWLGMGAGLPIVSLVTMIVAAVKLSNTQVTTWDRTGHFRVEHGKVGWFRTVIVVIIFAIAIYVVYGGARP